ncbi:MAG: ImmA/IrrE family metallo-endopeptidase [Planctomycetota bacterium]
MTRWLSEEARELARSAAVDRPIEAIRVLVQKELDAIGPHSLPLPLGPLLANLGVRKVRRKEMTIEGGLKRTTTGKFDILVRADRSPRRQRFTIAHELGHLLFYKYAPAAKRRQADTGEPAPLEEERLCNLAAEEILMPSWYVEELAGQTDDMLDMALRLADSCDVSLQAAALRVARATKTRGAILLWRRSAGEMVLLQEFRTGWHGLRLADFELEPWPKPAAQRPSRDDECRALYAQGAANLAAVVEATKTQPLPARHKTLSPHELWRLAHDHPFVRRCWLRHTGAPIREERCLPAQVSVRRAGNHLLVHYVVFPRDVAKACSKGTQQRGLRLHRTRAAQAMGRPLRRDHPKADHSLAQRV